MANGTEEWLARCAILDESAVHENFNFFENSVSPFPKKEVKRAINAH